MVTWRRTRGSGVSLEGEGPAQYKTPYWIFPHRHPPQYWAGCSRRAGPRDAMVRNNVFKVITIFYHSGVGKTTTEVAFEFPSVVLEPDIDDPNFRVADIQTVGPTSRPLPSSNRFGLWHFYKVFMPFLGLRRYVVYRECIQGTVRHKYRHLAQAG